MTGKALIVPCSGIGKTYGTVAREGAYMVTEDLRPDSTELVPLSLVVLGDEEVKKAVASWQTIAIDGCKLACAARVVAESGGTVAHAVQVLDIFRRRRELKPSGIAELNEGGRELARALAQEVCALADGMEADESNA